MAEFIDGLFPQKRIHLIGGSAGSGKTTLLAWALRQIQNGEEVFGRPTSPPKGGIYFIACDRKWEEYRDPIEKSGLQLSGHYSFCDDEEMTFERFTHPNPLPLLKSAFHKLNPKEESIVVVDVFGLFIGNDVRTYRPIMAYMWEYNRWIHDRNITLFGTVHAGKQKADGERYVRRFDRVMGAGALRGASSTAAYLTSMEETGKAADHQEFEICPRNEPASVFKVGWSKDGLIKPIELIDTPLEEAAKVLHLLPEVGNGITSEEMVKIALEHLKLSRTKVYMILKKLAEEGRIARTASSRKSGWVRLRVS